MQRVTSRIPRHACRTCRSACPENRNVRNSQLRRQAGHDGSLFDWTTLLEPIFWGGGDCTIDSSMTYMGRIPNKNKDATPLRLQSPRSMQHRGQGGPTLRRQLFMLDGRNDVGG